MMKQFLIMVITVGGLSMAFQNEASADHRHFRGNRGFGGSAVSIYFGSGYGYGYGNGLNVNYSRCFAPVYGRSFGGHPGFGSPYFRHQGFAPVYRSYPVYGGLGYRGCR